MEDFNLFEEDEIDTFKKGVEMNGILYDLRIKLANENYESVISKGIDFKLMKKQDIDVEPIVQILTDMKPVMNDVCLWKQLFDCRCKRFPHVDRDRCDTILLRLRKGL